MAVSSSSSTEELLKSLTNRGWCFSDLDHVRAIITINAALSGESSAIDAVESELCNVDLRSIGGKSLPDASLLRKPSHVLQHPKVLQACSRFPLFRLLFNVRKFFRVSGVSVK